MKRPAAPLRYAFNWYKKDNSVAIRREHRIWSESALRKLAESGISRCWPAAVRRAKLHSFSEPPSLEIGARR